jgi:hypothetical protein
MGASRFTGQRPQSGTAILPNGDPSSVLMPAAIPIELEKVEQIPDRRAVLRNTRIVVVHHRIREIIPAPARQRFQIPVSLDEPPATPTAFLALLWICYGNFLAVAKIFSAVHTSFTPSRATAISGYAFSI